MMSSRTWIAAFAVVASIAPRAHADGKNEIRAVTFDEDSGTTRVHVRGAQTPTFTVYKLEKPSRVVVDLPQSKLADVLRGHDTTAVFTPSTWAVSTIAAQQLDDGAVRVIVTMARPGRYDVKTEGNEMIVMVMPRDPAPKTTSPEELAKVQAESERMKQLANTSEQARANAQQQADRATQQADVATATAKQSRAEADAAKAEAERLRKTAADQTARAEAAQRAVEQAKHASTADLDKAKAIAAQAKSDADAARAAAASAQAAADRTRMAAEKARKDAVAEADRAKADAAQARADMQRMQSEANKKLASEHAETERAKADAARARDDMQRVETDAAAKAAEADRAKAEAAMARDDLQRAKAEAAAKLSDADRAKADAAKKMADAEQLLAKARADAERAKQDAAQVTADARQRTEQALAKQRADAEQAKRDAAAAMAAAEQARKDADAAKREQVALAMRANDAAKTEIAKAKDEAAAAKAEAARMRADADAARVAAAADKKQAETARFQAEAMMADAKTQLATLDKKTAAAQQLEDKARASNAAAQAREEAARDAEAKARQERGAAELAAKQAQDRASASDRASADERAKAAAHAKAAELRLAQARHATEDAETRRLAAETAAKAAKRDLEQTKSALSTVEQQRTAAMTAASDAARKRSDAEAAASDASRRRIEAEQAAAEAAKQRKDAELAASDATQRKGQAERDRAAAEAARVAALDAAKTAQMAKDAAEKQRKIAETAAQSADTARKSAEQSLGELTARRQAAEHAAAELEARSKAEAKAQAEVAAAQQRQINETSARTKADRDKQLADARADLAKLAADRKHAEDELADRRKAVALQQAESTRLQSAATQAHDAADREESRRAVLAGKRAAEEAELAKLDAQKQARAVKAQVAQVDPKLATTVPADGKLTKVTAVDFKMVDDGGEVVLAVDHDAAVTLGEVTATHVELIVDHAELGAKLERTLDVSKLGSPVRTVSSFRDRRTPNRVRLIAELSSPATPTVDRDAHTVRLRLASGDVAKHAPKTRDIPSPVMGGFGATSTPVAQQTVSQLPPQGRRNKIYHGAVVDFDIKDAPIHDLLRLIADTGHVSIVVPDTVDAKVTVKLKRVPWDEALEVILSSHGLWYRKDGNIYRVAPRKELDAEDEAENARREAAVKAETPRPETLILNYASAEDLKAKLEPLLSQKGKIEVDPRTNQLIVDDVAGNRAEIIKLALALDTQTPQISIEARIVEARSTFLRQIGIQWGGNANASAAGGNATGLIFPSSVQVTGANVDQQTNQSGVAQPSDFAVNLPAAIGTGEGAGIGFSLGSIGGNLNINLKLSALEDSGTVRIISAPKITVLNNKEAHISQGVSIPISVVSAAGTNTQFVQADLSLKVTPYVSQRDCAIAMNILVTKNEPDFVNVGARGDPTILRKEAATSMLVQDGETTVLGGIYTRNTGLAYKKVPFFGDIPVLGWFFKNRKENDDRTEILVFITPRITNKGSLRCTQ